MSSLRSPRPASPLLSKADPIAAPASASRDPAPSPRWDGSDRRRTSSSSISTRRATGAARVESDGRRSRRRIQSVRPDLFPHSRLFCKEMWPFSFPACKLRSDVHVAMKPAGHHRRRSGYIAPSISQGELCRPT
ncbi:hypothetical protein HMPREF0043_00451 [Actinobaculum sp. oral taxon 183 str. F0552]|nr:hypothetical protein HMPREF0043_00451 [Actinobaculum sp. oral taxon 183 str. F0552]